MNRALNILVLGNDKRIFMMCVERTTGPIATKIRLCETELMSQLVMILRQTVIKYYLFYLGSGKKNLCMRSWLT